MECVDAHIAKNDSFYCLFYEEIDTGEHLSRIYHFSGRKDPEVRLIAEIEEWLVSIWADRAGTLFGAVWDGRILSIGATVSAYGTVDLLGTIKLAGFYDQPRFVMGEDGLIFESQNGNWQQVNFRGDNDVYSVARRSDDDYLFAASGGRVIIYSGETASTEALPTNLDLHGIAFLGPDTGLVVGDEGVAFLYDSGAWTDVSIDASSLPDVHGFRGQFLVSVESDSIENVTPDGSWDTSLDQPGYYFSSNEDYCLTFFEEAAHVFDGEEWVSVPFGPLVGE